jgi:predicted DNA-binding antitoxin AbrB/MazE fold protein
MNPKIHAVFENGVFRPIESIDLPERSEVEFELRLVAKKEDWPKDYFEHTAGVFSAETFERPAQGTLLKPTNHVGSPSCSGDEA